MTTDAADAQAPSGARTARHRDLPVFFLHAGGLPIDAIAELFASTGCLGRPRDLFDLDGSMWRQVRGRGSATFADYLASEIDDARADGRRFAALIDWRDLLWLERRPPFRNLLRHPFRAVRLACLDPALQAKRRLTPNAESDAEPDFAALSRELIALEEDEGLGDDFARRHRLQLPRLWVEDLSRTGVPALRGLLDRWSIPLSDEVTLQPIDAPTSTELEAVAAFRSEARKRHWSHALTPRPA